MLRRIKRFLGLTSHSYFPNDEVAPADGSMMSTASRKSTKSEKKAAKKEKKKSPLTATPTVYHVPTPPAEIVTGGEDTLACSESQSDRQTIITDSLPYREPSDKVFLEPLPPAAPESSSSTRSLIGSESIKERMESVTLEDLATLPKVGSPTESIYSADFSQDTDSQKTCDNKSRELPVDCDMPDEKPMMAVSPQLSRISASSSVYMASEKIQMIQQEVMMVVEKKEDVTAMKKFNDELDGILKASSPPFQISTARLPPMLKELPPPPTDDSMISEEFNDSKNNSVARILNESHEAMMRSPENKHLRSCGY